MSHNTPVKTILILAANPATSRLRLDAEVRSIEEGLRRAFKSEQFKLVQKWAVRSRDFYRAILEHQPQIVHFCGHGAGSDGILLEDDNGLPYLVTTEELSKLFKLFAVKGVECVLLDACYLEVQAQAISQYIKYVIGMKQTIDDSKAIAFAVTFYDALGAGETVEFAYELGCTQLVELKEDQTPVLKRTSIQPVSDIQGQQLNEAKAFQKEPAALLRLSPLASEFIQKSLNYRRNNRLKLISFRLISGIFLTILFGFIGYRGIKISQFRDDVEKAKGQKDSYIRVKALEELVNLGDPLRNIELNEANLRGANLKGANLGDAILRGTDLRGGSLESANLRGTILESAILNGTDLRSADLERAILKGANLKGASLESANLERATLNGANLRSANLRSATLNGANLRSANLERAILNGADLRNASLERAILNSANLRSANLARAYLKDAILESVILESAIVWGANLESANLKGADLSSANLLGVNLENANLKGGDLKGADLEIAILWGANLNSANLKGADLKSADLKGASLKGADLKGADLSSTDLIDAEFGCAKNLFGIIECTNLKNAKNLTPEQVKQAKNWEKAEYDPEFRKKLGLPPVPEK
ncbi:hypothetical protein NUACC21_10660 [Scytonema sp. NUACC21]